MYGIFCMVVGVWVIFVDMELEKDLVFVIFFISYFVFIVIVGFFVFECGVILILDIVYRKVSIFLNIYYWLLFFGYLILMVMEVVYCFGIKGFILEMSMLFFVICWIVLKVGKVDFLFWYVNQFMLVYIFYFCFVVECFMWYLIYQYWEWIWLVMLFFIFFFFYIQFIFVIFLMMLYWIYKKMQQMIIFVDWNFEDLEVNKVRNGEVKKIV